MDENLNQGSIAPEPINPPPPEETFAAANLPEEWWPDCYIADSGQIFTPQFDAEGNMTMTEEEAYRQWTESQSEAPEITLSRRKDELVAKSKAVLAAYLEEHPLTWTDGEQYSVTMDKQMLLTSALARYQLAVTAGQLPELRWNASGAECTVWSYEDLAALALGIAAYVEPLVAWQQAIEVQINAAQNIEELENVIINIGGGANEATPENVPPVP